MRRRWACIALVFVGLAAGCGGDDGGGGTARCDELQTFFDDAVANAAQAEGVDGAARDRAIENAQAIRDEAARLECGWSEDAVVASTEP